MRSLLRTLTLIASVVVVALVASQAATASTVAVSVAATLLVVALAAVAGTVGARVVTVGSRAREHRESLTSMPEPAHPDTAGRTRARAPSVVAPAT